ncbi:hypothetical protein CH369_18030 [Leptospira levettii]|uniref:hypothetical protein n=1 Tax=Leptospira levettii TaxID=2023178 RepID=UPI000C29F09E|nr:hypothetical protein [Leptospira levettii]PJZ98864.1 hypothetical protein CH369_18030 [Leptospira levettii]
MALSVSLNELTYTIPEENETGYGLTLTTYLSDLADYLQFGYLSNVGQRLKLNTVSTSGTINNLNTNNISIVRLTNANIVSGIGNVVEGKFVTLINASANTIELTHQDPLSDTNNRFIIPGEKSFYLKPNETITLYYDSSETRWRLIDSSRFINENLSVNSTSGVITTLDTTNKTFIKLTNATEVKGINLPESGRKLYILNATLERILLKQESLDSTANERIITEFGYDYVLDPEAVVELIYDGNASRWRTINTDSIQRDKIDVITTSGAIHNLDIAKISVIKFTQATEVTGFNSNEEGRELIIFNDNSSPLTIKNESTDSTASNRIQTDTNSDVTVRQYGTAILKYDSSSIRWRIQSRTIDNSEYDDTYQLRSEKGVALGYASLDASGTVPVNQIDLSFFDLNDVTSTTFTGNKTKVVRVNNDETGLELGVANNTSNNYIEFPTSLNSSDLTTVNWYRYADGGAVPVDGQGGSPNFYFGTEVDSVYGKLQNRYPDTLSTGSEWFTIRRGVSGGLVIGDGVSTPFQIQAQHRGKILQVSFDYYLFYGNSVSTQAVDWKVYVINEDTGEVIYPDNNTIAVTTLQPFPSTDYALPNKFIASFQTDILSDNYRLCIHNNTNQNTVGTNFYFKNVKVWEPERNYGSIITEWQSYTATLTNLGSSPTQNLFWRRNGQNLEIKGRITTGSSVPSSVGSFSTPNGYVIDSSVCATRQAVGLMIRASGSINQCNVLALGGESAFYFSGGDGSTTNTGLVPQNTSSIMDSSTIHSINLSVPIAGWGGTIQLSSQVGDGRTVTGLVVDHTSQSMTSTVTNLKFNTVVKDSHGAYNTSTGELTIPVAGDYNLSINFPYQTTSSNEFRIYKNGTAMDVGGYWVSSGYTSAKVLLPNLIVGDVITVRPSGFSPTTTTQSTKVTNIAWNLISGGSQAFARDEFVGASYYSSSTQTSLTSQVNFGAKIYDTHNAVTTGSSWKFTAPQSGKYLVIFRIGGSSNIHFQIYKNNSGSLYLARTETPGYATGSRVIDLLAGDYIDIRPTSSATVNGNASSSSVDASSIEITKVS